MQNIRFRIWIVFILWLLWGICCWQCQSVMIVCCTLLLRKGGWGWLIVERRSFIICCCVKDYPLNLMVLEQHPPLYFTVLWVNWAWLGGSSCDDGGGTYIGAPLSWRMAHLHTLYLDRNGQKAGLTWDSRQLGLSLSLHAVPEFLLLHNTPPCTLSNRETWWYRVPQRAKAEAVWLFKGFEPAWQHFCSILSIKPSNRANLCSLWEHRGLHTWRGGLLEAAFGDQLPGGITFVLTVPSRLGIKAVDGAVAHAIVHMPFLYYRHKFTIHVHLFPSNF